MQEKASIHVDETPANSKTANILQGHNTKMTRKYSRRLEVDTKISTKKSH
jgi:hypothetical protein